MASTEVSNRRGSPRSYVYGPNIAWLEDHVPAARFGVRHTGKAAEILEAALALLLQEGLAAFSMRAVAGRVGMTLAALQYHFPAKDALVGAMINHKVQSYLDAFEMRMGGAEGAPDIVFSQCVEWLMRESLVAGLGSFEIPFWAMAAQDDYVRQAVASYMEVYHCAFAYLILQLNTTLTPHEARVRATLIVAMIEGSLPTCDVVQDDLFLNDIMTHSVRAARAIVRTDSKK